MMLSIEEYVQVSHHGGDVYIRMSKPHSDAKLPSYGMVTEFIRSKDFEDVDYAAIKGAYKKPGGDPVKFAKSATAPAQPTMTSSIEEVLVVSYQGKDVYIKINKPHPDARLPSYGMVTEFIRSKDFEDVNYKAVKGAYKKPGGDPVKFAKRTTELGKTSRFVIEITEDKMTCYVTLLPPRERESMINADAIVTEIKSKGVKCEIRETDINNTVDNKIFKKKIVAAKGSEPVPGKDSRLEPVARVFTTLVDNIHECASSSLFEKFELIHPVKAGDVVAKVYPPESGITGVDIFGNVMPSIDGYPLENTGANTEIQDGGVIAKTSGCAIRTEAGFEIEPLLSVDNVMNRELKHDGSIIILGDAEYCSLIEATGDIEIHGIVSNSALKAGRNIFIHGNVMSREEVTVKANHDFLCKNISNAAITAENVFVLFTILNSSVNASRAVHTLEKTGKIVDSLINAGLSVNSGAIGDEKASRTIVNVATPNAINQFRNDYVAYFNNKIDSVKNDKNHIAMKLDQLNKHMSASGITYPEANKKLYDMIKLELDKCDQEITNLSREIAGVKSPRFKPTRGEVIADAFYPGTVISLWTSSRDITEYKEKLRYHLKEANIFTDSHDGV